MLPVLYRFVFETDFSRVVLYLVALGLVAYSALNGWRNAGGVDAKGNPIEPTKEERRNRAITYGLVGVGAGRASGSTTRCPTCRSSGGARARASPFTPTG